VITRNFLCRKAIPALMAGIAFFLIGCHGRVSIKEKAERETSEDRFAAAESLLNRGDYDGALANYEAYMTANPRGDKATLALDRMAEISFRQDRYEESLALSKKILQEYPDYKGSASVQWRIIETLYRLGRYQESADEGVKWLETYPSDHLEGDVLILMGRDFNALSDEPEAFYWFLRAQEFYRNDAKKREELDQLLSALINTTEGEKLERLAVYAAASDYAPRVYQKLALGYIETRDMQKARQAAMAMVRSTPEQDWVSAGRELLERIDAEMSVRRGVVGCLLPLSGPFAIYGQEVLNGIELGMGFFGETGADQDLELVIRDTGGNPKEAVAAVEDLVTNEKVIAIVGPLSSKVALAAAGKAQELGVPIVTFTQREGITGEGDMVFRNFLTPSREVERLLKTAMDEWNLRRFAILYPDNSYGRFFMNLFWDRVEEKGGEVTAVEAYQTDETDFAAPIKKMTGLYFPRPASVEERLRGMRTGEGESGAHPEEPEPIVDFEAVFIPDNFQKVGMIAPQLVYQDVVEVLLMGTSLWQSPQLLETAGDYIQGAVFPSGFFDRTGESEVETFVEEYRGNFDSDPGILGATGYDTIRFLRQMMSKETISTREAFRQALLTPWDFQGVTGRISFDGNGEVTKEPLLLTVSGRHFTLLP
jgi:branched-chain amino acid transport system substrate-binding protein